MATYPAKALGELKQYTPRLPSVREEMRSNLIRKLQQNEKLFPEIIGYDDTLLPEIINAVMCGHNMIILGERGQGKSRIIRTMVDFLDEAMPAVEGCPIHDDPFDPICFQCREKLRRNGGVNCPSFTSPGTGG